MGRSPKHHPKRLTSAEREQLEQERETLRPRVARLDARGQTDTAHHTTLARIEAALGGDDAASASPLNQEDTDHGAS